MARPLATIAGVTSSAGLPMHRQCRFRARSLAAIAGATILVAVTVASCSDIVPTIEGCGGIGQGGASPACTYPPTAPPGAADEAAAVARARAAVGDGGAAATVVWASVERASSAVPKGHEWVWLVRLEGEGLEQPPCPSGHLDGWPDIAAPPCLDGEGGIDVVIDAFSTEVLGTLH